MGEPVPNQVLRYWLACVRMEEALGTRPRARRPPPRQGPVHIEMAQPVEGAEYLRMPCDKPMWRVASLAGELQLPVDAAVAAFFETWLNRQYRGGPGTAPQRANKRGDKRNKEAEDRVRHLLAFPVVHLPRQELAGLLRCDVQLDFLQPDGEVFVAPTAKARRAGQWPAAPTALRVVGGRSQSEGRLPFFVDTRLLHDQLGVEPQEIDAFFQALAEPADDDEQVTPLAMLIALCELLDQPEGGALEQPSQPPIAQSSVVESDEEAALALLVQRMNTRLSLRPTGAKAYQLSIIVDGQQARSTWHLQRELQLLIEEAAGRDEDDGARPALDAYLSGEPPAAGLAVQRAAYPGSVLTPSQRGAAERFLGSPLCAVQGPPGTGKTTMILHLAAEHILEQVDGLVDQGTMGDALMVVASTNNRAVDNVIEPLNLDPALGGGGLPLALRTGSREVCEKVTTRQIRDAMAWVARCGGRSKAQDPETQASLKAAVATYKDLRERLIEGDAARVANMQRWTRRERARRELAALDNGLARCSSESEAPPPAFSSADLNLVKRVPAALEKLANLAGARASPKALRRLDRAHAKFQQDMGEKVNALHERFASAEPWPLPCTPKSLSVERVMEAWEEAIEQCVGAVEALIDAMTNARQAQHLMDQRDQLVAELKALETAHAGMADSALEAAAAELEPLRAQLFVAALAVREAWAVVHAAELGGALEVAARGIAAERSMRSLFRAEDEAGRWLRRLCGVWGCTLLSMANAVPAESKGLRRVVIDEAGQCHPAHAISALMRCQSALVIGDVHQLEPVIGLGPQDEGRVQAQANVRLPSGVLEPYRVFSESQNSVQSLADRALGGPLRLVDHFRCQPPIIAMCDALCGYGLTIHTRPASRAPQAPFLRAPLLFMEVEGQQERLGGSWVNHGELEACMALLQDLIHAGIGSDEVAIITPYRGQLELLQRAAAQRGIPIARGLKPEEQLNLFGSSSSEQGLTLGTVHRFQGGERSIVIFSSVVTQPRSLGFLNNRPNLLNVTVSRAREHLVTLGHGAALAAGRYTRHLVNGDSFVSA